MHERISKVIWNHRFNLSESKETSVYLLRLFDRNRVKRLNKINFDLGFIPRYIINEHCKLPFHPFGTPETCKASTWPKDYPKIFKDDCPTAYSYAYDDHKSTFTCRGKNGALSAAYLITLC
ncbi:hypothetical protein QR680_015056 [Steinernema hermaphroditum]|uniref:Uncharacterized protein n=1 Tax=Steinernema hermaphroditum TaxID=289476 RepID=A0AA39ID95_9BILA|nr:hypothetical protein QR680_015056 [Steinernema hermaphroditum]